MGFDSFRKTTDVLHRALDVNILRYNVTANNLASSGIPGFKRSVVNFETELKRAFDSQKNKDNSFEIVKPFVALDYQTSAKANGNNVDAETEANAILQIQMQYRLLTQLTGFEFSQVDIAMRK